MYLAFGKNSKNYALKYENLIEIYEYEDLLSFPIFNSEESLFKGLTLFHGEIIPVINSKKLLEIPIPSIKYGISTGENGICYYIIPVHPNECFPFEEKDISKRSRANEKDYPPFVKEVLIVNENIVKLIDFRRMFSLLTDNYKKLIYGEV